MDGSRRSRRAGALALALVAGVGCSPADLNPVEEDAGEAGITLRVVGCEPDPQTGLYTMTYEVESEREYNVVLVEGRLKDASGVIVASSSGSVTNAAPGEVYRQEMVLSPSGEPEGTLDCEASLDLATEPLG